MERAELIRVKEPISSLFVTKNTHGIKDNQSSILMEYLLTSSSFGQKNVL